MKLIKKIASRVLANELASLRQDVERYKYLSFGRKYVILPSSAASCIVDMLPNPNMVATGQFTTQQLLLALNAPKAVRRYTYVLQGKEHSSEIRLVADTRTPEEKSAEQGLMVELVDFRIRIFVPLVHAKMNTQVAGVVGAEVDTYVWDLYRAGLRVIGDADFNMIMEFVVAQNKVLNELNEEV